MAPKKTSETPETVNPEPAAAPEAAPEIQEVNELSQAIENVKAKITGHEEEIHGHETEITKLQAALQEAGLSFGRPRKTRSSNGTTTVRGAILQLQRDAGGPVSTEQVKAHLTALHKKSNPSVELSRMVKAGLLKRVGRGLYTAR